MSHCKVSSSVTILVVTTVLLGILASWCGGATLYVAPETDPARTTHDGSSWATAYALLEDALTQAASGDEVWVAKGTYYQPYVDMYSFQLSSGVKLYGGFSENGGDWASRDPKANETILDGATSIGVAILVADSSDATTTIDGFTLRNNPYSVNGGGIDWGGPGQISNNIITGCYGDLGAISCSGPVKVTRNILHDNTGSASGGICCWGGSSITDNLIYNSSGYDTGAIYCYGDSTTVANNTIADNTADASTGAIGIFYGSSTIANNIIAFNTGGGVYLSSSASATLSHNDLYQNTEYDYSPGLSAGTGDISSDPLFVDRSLDDYHLAYDMVSTPSKISPCIDAGDDAYAATADIDLDGRDRRVDTMNVGSAEVDMGAYENPPDSTSPSTPIVTDDGAFTADVLHATWSSSDPESGISLYRYAIGTTPLSSNVVDWTITTATSVTYSDLQLTPGSTYYFTVSARNGVGLWSATRVSDGITAVHATVDQSSEASANRKVMGVYQWYYGKEFWNQGALTSQYQALLDSWKYGAIRTNAGEEWAWDADETAYAKWSGLYRLNWEHAYSPNAFPDTAGHLLGISGYAAIANRSSLAALGSGTTSDTVLSWVVNMAGCLDSYGKAVGTSPERTQGASIPVYGVSYSGEPTPQEKRYWYLTPADTAYYANDPDNPGHTCGEYSIYDRTKDLANTLETAYLGPKMYELSNEVYCGLRIPEAYWASHNIEGEPEVKRIAWGTDFLGVNDQLGGHGSDAMDRTFNWSSAGSIGEDGNVLYLAFPYKPWAINLNMAIAGAGGTANWQYYSDTGWKDLTPTGCRRYQNGTYCVAQKSDTEQEFPIQKAMYDSVTNLRFQGGDTCLFLLTLPKLLDLVGNREVGAAMPTESAWTSGSDFLADWSRRSLTTPDGAERRSMYWLRVYATSVYSANPKEYTIATYQPEPIDWLKMCKALSGAIKAADDPNAKVLYSGFAFYPGSGKRYTDGSYVGYMGDYAYTDSPYWHFLLQDSYKDFWDGVVIHPYVYPTTFSNGGEPGDCKVNDMVNDGSEGLLKRIDEMRAVLNDPDYNLSGNKIIACTEWGASPSSTTVPQTFWTGLYNLEGTMEMLSTHLDAHGTVRNGPDYATWHASTPRQLNLCSPFYNPTPMPLTSAEVDTYPGTAEYVLRPLGLAMKMAATYYRTKMYGVSCGRPRSDLRAYAFGQSGKTSTMILINKTDQTQTATLYWPEVQGKSIYASYFKSLDNMLDSNNEDSGDQRVVLTEPTCLDNVSAQGSFTINNIQPYSAVGLEFRD